MFVSLLVSSLTSTLAIVSQLEFVLNYFYNLLSVPNVFPSLLVSSLDSTLAIVSQFKFVLNDFYKSTLSSKCISLIIFFYFGKAVYPINFMNKNEERS